MALEQMTKSYYSKEGRLEKHEVWSPPKRKPTHEQVVAYCQYLQSQLEYWEGYYSNAKTNPSRANGAD
jgi:hypothetical protein